MTSQISCDNFSPWKTFCASGNKKEFLTDETGNRRWLPFEEENTARNLVLAYYRRPGAAADGNPLVKNIDAVKARRNVCHGCHAFYQQFRKNTVFYGSPI
ncbi:MAG: virulence-associated E family protein [Prevotellaceae bacterium]|nr:virulence-associated E family protein [Prevotellaceae bacterium]